MSSTSSPPQATTVDTTSKPRWQFTPPAMKAPVRVRGPEYDPNALVNSDPKKLDAFYVKMLGEGGDKLLSEEVKWQAITHKSFDQGRRGFNDRLAYLGMGSFPFLAYIELQTLMMGSASC
jgi:large subunit ribosomal protein L15